MNRLLFCLALAGCSAPAAFELAPDAATARTSDVADAAQATEVSTDAETDATPDVADAQELTPDAASDADAGPADAAQPDVADAQELTPDAASDAGPPDVADAQEFTPDAAADASQPDVAALSDAAADTAPADVRVPTPEERCTALTDCAACLTAPRAPSGLGCGWCEGSRRCRYEDDSSFGCGSGWLAPGSACR